MSRVTKRSIGAWVLILAMAATSAPADPDTWARTANTEFRAAQSLFHNGKRQESMAKLSEVHRLVGQIRAANPEDPRLGGLQNQINRLKADLERRLGGSIDLDQGVLIQAAAAPIAAPATAAPATSPARLPHYADLAMSSATRALGSVKGPYSRFDYYREQGDYDAILKSLDSIDETLAEVPESIEEARRLAAERGITEYPGFDEAYAQLEQEKERSAQTRQQTLRQASAAADASDSVTGDIETFAAACDRWQAMLLKDIYGHAQSFTELEEARAFLERIEAFEKEELPAARQTLTQFAATYGSDRDAIDRKVEALGYTGNRRPGARYEEVVTGIDNLQKTRAATAGDLLRRAQEDLDDLPRAHDFFRAERRARARAFAEMAARYDGESGEIRQFLADLPARLDADIKAMNARIDARTWPGSIAGKRAEQEAGLDYFKKDSDWGARPGDKEPRHPVAVAITGDWTVQKSDLLGRPILYGVAAIVAVEVPREKAQQNVLRVYHVTLRTAEGADVKQAPPFREITVGDSYYIRPNAVK